MPLSSNPVKDTRFSTSELGFKSLRGHLKNIYLKIYYEEYKILLLERKIKYVR